MTPELDNVLRDPELADLFRAPAVVLAALPGDEVIGTGAALRHMALRGEQPLVIVFTEDESNSGVAPQTGCDLAGNVNRSLGIANVLGYDPPLVWRSPKGRVSYDEELVARILSLLRDIGAASVFAPSLSEPRYERFAVGLAAREAVRRFGGECVLVNYAVKRAIDATHVLEPTDGIAREQKALMRRQPTLAQAENTVRHGSALPSRPKEARARQNTFEEYRLACPADAIEPPPGMAHSACWLQGPPVAGEALVSVIIRTTGRPELTTSLDSVALQTYPHIEVVLVDVLGQERLGAAARCGRHRMRVVTRGRPLSRGAACNAGMDAATGMYVIFLDDDDWFHPDHVSVLVRTLRAHPDCRAAYTGIDVLMLDSAESWQRIRVFNEDYDAVRLLVENYIPIHAVIFERDLLGEGVRFDESLAVYEDWDFWVQLSRITKLTHTHQMTAVYRISKTSGFGVRPDDPAIASGTRVFFSKWRTRWTPDELVGVINYQKRQVEFKEARLEQASAEHAQVVRDKADLSAKLSRMSQDLKLAADREKAQLQAAGTHIRALEAEREEAQELRARLALSEQALITGAEDREALRQKHARVRDRLNTFQYSAAWPVALRLHALEVRMPRLVRALMRGVKLVGWTVTFQLPSRLREHLISQQILRSGLFDESWYIANNEDALLLGYRAIVHWRAVGRYRRSRPSPIFDTDWYMRGAGLSANGETDALLHYLEHAVNPPAEPSPLFDTAWYLRQGSDNSPDPDNPLGHYLVYGWRAGLSPHPLFDVRWYISAHPDCYPPGAEPLAHYLATGAVEGCDPHPLFFSTWYLEQNPDVARSGANPLVHFLTCGAEEGRNPNPLFDCSWYMEHNPEVRAQRKNPLVHFVEKGGAAMRDPHAGISLISYQFAHPDLPADGVTLLAHQLSEMRRCMRRADFDDIGVDERALIGKVKARPRDYLLSALINDTSLSRVRALAWNIGCVPCRQDVKSRPLDRLLGSLESIDAVTFDLFDTLVERLVLEPRDIFWLVGVAHYGSLTEAERYASVRMTAERNARLRANGPEVTLAGIMREVQEALSLSDEEVVVLQNHELEAETASITAKPEGALLYDAAARAGKSIAILTDTYLPADFVRARVAGAGYVHHDDDSVYISSARNATKHDGSLFRQWLAEQDQRMPNRVLHIGDNEHSDGVSARKHGFVAAPVTASRDAFFANPLASRSWPDEYNDIFAWRLSLGLVIKRWSALRSTGGSGALYLGNPYLLGYSTLGPLLLGFVANLINFADRRGTSGFYFLSRDGYMLQAAYETVTRAIRRRLPAARYVMASRVLCNAASLDCREEVLRVASDPHFPLELGKLMRMRFSLSDRELKQITPEFYRRHGFEGPAEVIKEGDERKERFFSDLAPMLVKLSAPRAERYKAYLESLHISDAAAVVDIGYAGTAQRLISRLLDRQVDGAYLITSQRIARLDGDGLHSEGWLADRAVLDHAFFTHVQLWEMFLSASHGSVVDVGPGTAGREGALFDDNMFDEAVRGSLSVIHRGAFEFVRDFMDHYGSYFEQLSFNADAFCRPLAAYFADPAPADCAYLAQAVFEDHYGGDVRRLAASIKSGFDSAPAMRGTLIWREATQALSGLAVEPTPFYPASPVDIARATGRLNTNAALVDAFDATGIAPVWRTETYTAIFGRDGWPRCESPNVSIRMLLPVTDCGGDRHPVFDSWRQFVFRGVAMTIALVGETEEAPAWVSLPSARCDLVHVATWGALTAALENQSEQWVLLNDGHTTLDPTTPAELVAQIQAHPDAEVIMFDEDWSGSDGYRKSPHFKPGWSPELLLSTDYLGGAFAVKWDLLRGIRTQSETHSGWIWEVALAVTEKTDRVERIPRILAHRSEACYQRNLAAAQREAEGVLSDWFQRLGVNAVVRAPGWARDAGRLACQPVFSNDGPAVAVIIPTKNQCVVTKRCVDSLARTTYCNYQLYLVDNDSDDPEALKYFETLQSQGVELLRISSPSSGFSYSFVNNRAVEKTQDEPYLLFLNNDTEVVNPNWLSQMMGWMRLPGIGAVGAQLLFANGTIQHAGITHKLLYNVLPAPSLKGERADQGGYQDYIYLNRNSAAQTAACLLTSRKLFTELGMFDEVDFGVAYNDCDFGFKLTQAGLRTVYCADALLYHHEGSSRGVGRGNDKPSEEAAFVRKYMDWEDPFYNPNLAVGRTDFAIRPTAVATVPTPHLRVAVCTHNLNYEGAPRVLMELGTGLAQASHMEVIVLSPVDGPLRSEYEESGCGVHVLPEVGEAFRSDQDGFGAVTAIAARLIADCVDVVIANTVLCWWGVEAADIARVPSIWIIHESEPPFTHLAEHGPECQRRGRRALALPYRVVFVAEATRDVFASLETMNNYVVFHNGYDATADHHSILNMPKAQVRAGLDIGADALVGLLPGNVIERKSQIDLVHAVRQLDLDVIQNLKLIILGDRPSGYSDALHREISSLDPVRRRSVAVLPYAEGAERYFRAADFMISTSRLEAFPRIVQEAMLFELPMIVAPVYGIREQVTDEVSALFFPPGDSARLARQIERLFWCPDLRQRLAANARVTLDRFPTVAEMTDFYANLVREASLSALVSGEVSRSAVPKPRGDREK